MTTKPTLPKKTSRDKADLLMQMTKEAQRVGRRTGAKGCIVICVFEENNQMQIQDAGMFPPDIPPEKFYHIMMMGHAKGLMGAAKPSKIIKPH